MLKEAVKRKKKGKMEEKKAICKVAEFMRIVYDLKKTSRKGWVLRGVQEPESVSK